MSSPHNCTANTARTNTQNSNGIVSSLHLPCTVYIGKEQYHINSTPPKDVSVATWKQQRGYYQLETAILLLRSTHQVVDLMELVCQDIPLDVDSVAQDATKLMGTVVSSVYKVNNLDTLAFLTDMGKQANLTSEKISNRPENVSFFRLSYNLDPSSSNPRLTQKPTFFSFCLRLPQYRYYKTDDRVKMIYSLVAKSGVAGIGSKMSSVSLTAKKPVKMNLFGTPLPDHAKDKDQASTPDLLYSHFPSSFPFRHQENIARRY